jgi:plastocyanin
MKALRALIVSVGMFSALGVAGCQNDGYSENDSADNMKFRVVASNTDIVAGDVVTFTTRSENTLGRDPKVTWTTTGGDIDAEEGGRVARATFKSPGTYTVTGKLELDGHVVRSDSVDVRVKSVR